jgi:predicted aspartyl protease
MGKVTTTLTIINRADEILAANGVLPATEIRKITLNDVLVDTAATVLSLPKLIIQQLDLSPLKEVLTSTAAGYQRATVFQDAKVSLMGREGVFQCFELPGGDNPLLGVIPMEELGVAIDLQKQELKLLPMEPGNTYYLTYGAAIVSNETEA